MSRELGIALRLIQEAVSSVADVTRADAEEVRDWDGPDREDVLRLRERNTGKVALMALRPDDGRRVTDRSIIVLRKAAAGTLRSLRQADVQFVDVGRGIVRLRLPWLYVDRTDLDIPVASLPPGERAYRDPFGDRASLISRLLVEHPARRWGTREIADEAGVSTMTASHVLRQLRELEVLDVRMRGRAFEAWLCDLPRLIGQWSRHYDWTRCARLEVQAAMGSPERFIPRLGTLMEQRRWALTLHAGAAIIAPYASWDTIHVYVDVPDAATLEDVARSAGWNPGPGKLVLMRPWYSESAWVGIRTSQDIPIVSDLQLVLDLWNYPVRGREQADVLLKRMELQMRERRVGTQ